jgi:hypothetical protein
LGKKKKSDLVTDETTPALDFSMISELIYCIPTIFTALKNKIIPRKLSARTEATAKSSEVKMP